jgi:hypothetical protein
VTLRVSEGTFEGRSPTLGTLKCSLSLASKRQKPRGQPYKLTDENGLHLLINPNGSKLWRFRYRFGGKQLIVAPGVVAASGYETPATSYIVANTTRIYSDLAVYGTNVTGELKRGEKVEALAKVKGWEWLLVGRQGTGCRSRCWHRRTNISLRESIIDRSAWRRSLASQVRVSHCPIADRDGLCCRDSKRMFQR